ncbi:hypothetical protein OQA88_9283 [Cercophora sp. LCS_1]
MSFVRDPRFPHGGLRIATLLNVIARGHHVKAERRMAVRVGAGSQTSTLRGEAIERDAPLILAHIGPTITTNTAGELTISNYDAGSSVWSPLTPIIPYIRDNPHPG